MRVFFTTAFFVICFVTFSQNMVPNPSFDYFSECPEHHSSEIEFAKPWRELVTTVDYYHSCDNGGDHNGRTCAGEAGIHAWWSGWTPGYREYFGVGLTSPMVAGKDYYVEFWVKWEGSFIYATDDIGMYITSGPVWGTAQVNYWNLVPQIENAQGNILSNDTAWTKICGTYTANGGESFIILGCFRDESSITLVNLNPNGQDRCYYYFDDVFVGLKDSVPGADSCHLKDVTAGMFKCKEEAMALPNIFTPNGDGTNDHYFPITLEGHLTDRISMWIYDRWGRKIVSLKNTELGWDGKIDGKDASDGVYFVTADYYEQPYNSLGKLHGFFHLAR